MKKTPLTSLQGFSLVEVTLALGIAAFCLVAVLGLLPVGLKSNQTSIQQTRAADIALAIAADLRAAAQGDTEKSPIYGLQLPAVGEVTKIQTVRFGDSSKKLARSDTPAPSVRATVYLSAPASGKGATTGRIQITWPAEGDSGSDDEAPAAFNGSYDTFIALNRN